MESTSQASTGQDADVVIIGAGPVGLTIANTLGLAGVSTLVVERLPQIIDYPRAIGIDDESLRTLQAIGLAEQVQTHITPDHWMRFLTADGRCFASIEPRTDEFGWSRRNAFIQPQVDAILYQGLQRFAHVRSRLGQELTDIAQDAGGVSLGFKAEDGTESRVRARYVVAADGGNSFVRRTLGVAFEGRTKPNQWIVVDVRNDPLGTPHIDMCCDPERPYVSAALPHGIRRFEFMVMPGETEEELSRPENMARLMAKVVPHPDKLDYIRKRVYTHNARLASTFRVGRVLLAGDAAHIMPVWQGQGYNSGMRDASNLAWKLALVAQGKCGDAMLDSYTDERRDHARAMIHLSEVAGDIFAPESATAAKVRDRLMLALNAVPPVKAYFAEMRFKPMPRYEKGVVLLPERAEAGSVFGGLLDRSGDTPMGRLIGLMAQKKESLFGRLINGLEAPLQTPVGRMFIQPRVTLADGASVRLDEAIGLNFAIIAWGTDPTHGMRPAVRAFWERLGTRFIKVKPLVQMAYADEAGPGVTTLGDTQGRIKDWFTGQSCSIAVVRPDRFVAAMTSPHGIDATTARLAQLLHAPLEA
ncbi:bifunctional 3-(3-hydroxy-phenyl)propionate/3-hydroxycinnamic acid hydroxylase [Pseudorhodoferax sp. LjRoot39]|uniref:bifunctional 3-(3-hydroxy-phenyl)propionate/3-hydroxycinnamic acid hydroxylase MhpA n=1 Tax=Pseudorhodoferax sp. LjRoot39 TaxID=3342328 RepID=UPI003ECE31B5